VRVLPQAPLAGRVLANQGIRVGEQCGVGIHQALIPELLGDCAGEPAPLPGEDAPDVLGDPLDFSVEVVVTPASTKPLTRSG
jgi:hypothetical protein